MTTPESKVKKAVSKILDAREIYYFYPATHGYGRSGIPDIIACVNSVFVAIECKAGKGKTTALQDREIRRIRQSGGIAILINETNIDELTECLNGI
jgi:Holliday junction resolvase